MQNVFKGYPEVGGGINDESVGPYMSGQPKTSDMITTQATAVVEKLH